MTNSSIVMASVLLLGVKVENIYGRKVYYEYKRNNINKLNSTLRQKMYDCNIFVVSRCIYSGNSWLEYQEVEVPVDQIKYFK